MSVLDTTTMTPASACLNCGAEHDRASGNDGASPAPGDWSICVECGGLSVFADDLTLRPPSAEENEAAIKDAGVAQFRLALARAHGRLADAPSKSQ